MDEEFCVLQYLQFAKKITSKGRVAMSGAHISDVKDTPVGINIVLTWINDKGNVNIEL